jgi:hypothetical protein
VYNQRELRNLRYPEQRRVSIDMATNKPASPCNIEIAELNKAMEALKEAHEHSTNSAGIWENILQIR